MIIKLVENNEEHGLSSPPGKGEYPEGGRGSASGLSETL